MLEIIALAIVAGLATLVGYRVGYARGHDSGHDCVTFEIAQAFRAGIIQVTPPPEPEKYPGVQFKEPQYGAINDPDGGYL